MDRDLQGTVVGKSYKGSEPAKVTREPTTGNSNKSTGKNSDNCGTDPRNNPMAPNAQVTGAPKTGDPSNTSKNLERNNQAAPEAKATSYSIENSNDSENGSRGTASQAHELKQDQVKATSENTPTPKHDGKKSGPDGRNGLAPGSVLPNATRDNPPTDLKNRESYADSKEGSAKASLADGLQKMKDSAAPELYQKCKTKGKKKRKKHKNKHFGN